MQQRLLLLQTQQAAMINRQRNRVYVGSLPYDLPEDEVRIAFEPFGTIQAIDMPKVPGVSKKAPAPTVNFLV